MGALQTRKKYDCKCDCQTLYFLVVCRYVIVLEKSKTRRQDLQFLWARRHEFVQSQKVPDTRPTRGKKTEFTR